MTIRFVFALFTFVSLILLSGCSNKSSTSDLQNSGEVITSNQAPIAKAIASEYNITVGDTIDINASGSEDLDGHIISYEWRDDNGNLLIKKSDFQKYFDTPGVYYFTLIITDDKGETSQSQITITVRAPENTDDSNGTNNDNNSSNDSADNDDNISTTSTNQPPVAIVADDVIEINSGDRVTFDGTSSYDPDGDSITYKWIAANDIVLGSGSKWSGVLYFEPWLDTDNDGTITYTKTLIVTDEFGNSASKQFQLIMHKNNQPPTVEIQESRRVLFGSTVTLFANAQDVDGTIVSYEWIRRGNTNTLGTTASITLTNLAIGTHFFVVTVRDNDGAETEKVIAVKVYLTGA